jgi:beta-lactamase class A
MIRRRGGRVAFGLILAASLVISGGGRPAGAGAPAQAVDPQAAAPSTALLVSSAPTLRDAGLGELITSALGGAAGQWEVVVKKLDTGQAATYRSSTPIISASLYKLFVLYEVFRQWDAGSLRLDESLPITASAAAEDAAIGNLKFTVGSSVPIRVLLDRMIAVSDNTAAITLTRRVGIDNVNRTLQAIGLSNSRLDFAGDNLTTADDVADLLERIAAGRAVSQAASRQMLDLLLGQELNDLIPATLPANVPVAHKTGTLDGLRHDAGIVYGPSGPYVFVVMSTGLADTTVAYRIAPMLSLALYRYFNNHPSQPARYFAGTGQFVASPFLRVWNTYDGATTLGDPIGPEQVVDGYRVQWFERGRLGLPPGSASPDRVEFGDLGREALGDRAYPARPDPANPAQLWFSATGQVIQGGFLAFWQTRGGQRLFGNPISPELTEDLPGLGPTTVQYFERARLESRPDGIAVSDLGRQLQDDAP